MRAFIRIRTAAGPRTTIFSAPEETLRLMLEEMNFDAPGYDEKGQIIPGMVILPDAPATMPISVIVAQRAALLDKEIVQIARNAARRLARKKPKQIPQPDRKLLAFKKPK